MVTGHNSAEGVSVNQPAKLAAFEGHYDSMKVADMYLLGIVNQDKQTVSGIKIPGGTTEYNKPKYLKGFWPVKK